jgi:hypothetical protein
VDVTGDTQQFAEAVARHLVTANTPPTLFEMGQAIVRVAATKAGTVVKPLDRMALRVLVGSQATLFRMREGRDGPWREQAELSNDKAEYILAMGGCGLPNLGRVVSHPVFARDGRMVAEPGYDPGAEVFVDLGGLTLPTVPEAPTPGDLDRARTLILDDLLGDFPFAEDASRAHAVGLGLVPLVRDMIDGPVPGHVVEGTGEGIGKTLLARTLSLAATGSDPHLHAEVGTGDEWRKTLTAILATAPEIVVFDNLTRHLNSSALAMAITGGSVSDRLLGTSNLITVPVRAVLVFTANNPTMVREAARRMVVSRLDARVETPWLREGFKHSPLLPWVRENRHDLLWAFLVLVQNWLALGRPRSTAVKGSFEEWAAVVGGILDTAGVPGFLANEKEFAGRADTETAAWRSFVQVWWEAFGERTVGVGDLFGLARTHTCLLDEIGGDTESSQRARLGKQLVKRVGRIVAGKRLSLGDPNWHVGVNGYRLEADG